MKLKVSCPICGTEGSLEVPEGAWDKVKGNTMMGRVVAGKVCDHQFKVEFSRAGSVLGYAREGEREKSEVRPVKFTVRTAINNLGFEILSALLTAGVSEQTIVLLGSLPVTVGVRNFMDRVLPDSVDVGACVYMVTREEYAELPDSTKQHMTVDIGKKTITNSVFDEEQLAWIQKVLTRANMVSNIEDAETLILKETSKLRTTVSLLRHLASRRGAGKEGKNLLESE